METLTYLYGIVPVDAPDPPTDLAGLDGGPVHVLRGERVAGLVSEVAAADYSAERVDARLSDLAWVGERGVAHEQVLDWFAERGPVIPLSLFSLHQDAARVLERLGGDEARFKLVLEKLRGRREWAVKIWREDAVLGEHLGELSPAIAALGEQIANAPPGRRFLLEKKREELKSDEMRRVSARVVHEIYAQLRSSADRAQTLPLPASAPQTGRSLALYAAFLVTNEGFTGFQAVLSQLAATFRPSGFDFEFTGPWPPYHFTDPDVV